MKNGIHYVFGALFNSSNGEAILLPFASSVHLKASVGVRLIFGFHTEDTSHTFEDSMIRQKLSPCLCIDASCSKAAWKCLHAEVED